MTRVMTTVTAKIGVLLRAAAALAIMLALAVGVPWLLLVTIGNPVPSDGWTWTQPLTNQALLGLIAVLAWLFWAQMIGCLCVEVVAELRVAAGRSADWMTQVPGTFAGQQHLARFLVQAVVAVGLGASVVPSSMGAEFADAALVNHELQATELVPDVASFGPARADIANRVESAIRSDRDLQPTRTVEVAKGDTLWSIAERCLGSGELWRHVAVLNEGRLMPDGERFVQAASIQPGWRLLVPAPPGRSARVSPAEVTVVPGDTLWGLAKEAYGDGNDWPRLLDANRDKIADPDLIYPDQVLDVPHGDVPTAGQPDEPDERDESDESDAAAETDEQGSPGATAPDHPGATPPVSPEPAEAHDTASPGAETVPPGPGHTSDAPGVETSDRDGDGHLTAALVGGGGLLAGGALVMFLAQRRRRFRIRRSGRTIASTPPDLVPAEATLLSTGSAGGVSARFLDRALRDLSSRVARSGADLPEVAAVRLGDDRIDLLLASPAPSRPPMPWVDEGQGERWTLARQAPIEDSDALAPYPGLVAIGTADDGATWLLDLEAAGVVHLVGDSVACEDLARFIGAELALNVWSDDVDVTLAGFAGELAGLNPGRLRCADQPDVDGLIKTARRVHEGAQAMGCDVLGGRLDGAGGDTWMPKILLVTAAGDPDRLRDDLGRLLDELAVRPGRDAVAVVTIGDPAPVAGGMSLTVDQDRKIVLSPWKVRLGANQLTAADAQTLARLLGAADDAEDEPMPPAAGARPFEEVSDAAGAFQVELTQLRDGGGDQDSLLPLADEEYLAVAATTSVDLAALAPNVPRQTRARALALDASLDEDLAAWSDPDTSRPRLRLLGPVEVRAKGERTPDVDRRCAYYTELVAYLAARDNGATPQQVAEAFGVQTNTMHSRIGIVRKWLGADPATGSWYLPESTLSPSGKARGVPVYEVAGLLCDADLFKRLRVRGQARGPDGIEDLVAALRFVEGIPFDQQRPGGYAWLAETPLDQYLTAGVVDVAHIVSTHALTEGEEELALWASERAIVAAPSEDKPRLDLVRALSAMGRTEEADEYVAAAIYNRSDDAGPPPAPAVRTTEVLEAHGQIRREADHPTNG